ncbi:uncharacterized protein LOC120118371 [Hibiscus syriacus]|uniref:uncharacterized protein LOC120118371 n=1 Tax=Hibiscus syriacus TaxID=106335 RepID=UPI001922E9BD|nr:uncharacterized protein LOC120118371 [Hibiscus syriacus]
MSLGLSFSGLLHFMLDYFVESVILVLSHLIASDVLETRSFDSLKLLREVRSQMELGSELKNFKAASGRSEHARTSNQSSVKIDVSVESILKQEHLFSGSAYSSPKQALNQSGSIISHPRKRVSSKYC